MKQGLKASVVAWSLQGSDGDSEELAASGRQAGPSRDHDVRGRRGQTSRNKERGRSQKAYEWLQVWQPAYFLSSA